jgi:hypothetical protein
MALLLLIIVVSIFIDYLFILDKYFQQSSKKRSQKSIVEKSTVSNLKDPVAFPIKTSSVQSQPPVTLVPFKNPVSPVPSKSSVSFKTPTSTVPPITSVPFKNPISPVPSKSPTSPTPSIINTIVPPEIKDPQKQTIFTPSNSKLNPSLENQTNIPTQALLREISINIYKKSYIQELIQDPDDLVKLINYILEILYKLPLYKIDYNDLYLTLFKISAIIHSISLHRLQDKYNDPTKKKQFDEAFNKLLRHQNKYRPKPAKPIKDILDFEKETVFDPSIAILRDQILEQENFPPHKLRL